jgi:pyridoxine kinase
MNNFISFKNPIKKVAAIHDLSGFGRSALSVVIPILSTMKLQVCSLPTAVLSSETSGFEEYSFIDLTEYMVSHIEHWKKIYLEFDCIYSGFLGSPKQVEIIKNFIKDFKKEKTIVVVDPVMGDNGDLYSSVRSNMIEEMRKLIESANIITPNYTEACFLLGEKYDKTNDEKEIKAKLVKLSNLGPEIVVITSVPVSEKVTSVVAYNKITKKFWKVECDYIPVNFPGTGDSFTSVLTGSILNGESLPVALDKAVQFINNAIKESIGFDYDYREGVLLEKILSNLKYPVLFSNYKNF